MMRLPLLQRLVVSVLLSLTAAWSVGAQDQHVELLLPGAAYHRDDLPTDPSGPWWVLHQPNGQAALEAMQITVTPFRTCGDADPSQRTGRAVQVPTARDTIVLLRGLPGIGPRLVRTVFVDDTEAGESERVEVPWDDVTVVVQRIVDDPRGDQPGQYRIEHFSSTVFSTSSRARSARKSSSACSTSTSTGSNR